MEVIDTLAGLHLAVRVPFAAVFVMGVEVVILSAVWTAGTGIEVVEVLVEIVVARAAACTVAIVAAERFGMDPFLNEDVVEVLVEVRAITGGCG